MELILKRKIAAFIKKNRPYRPKANCHLERVKQERVRKFIKMINISRIKRELKL